jgi:hypothetical protein
MLLSLGLGVLAPAGCQSDDGPSLVRRSIGPQGGVIASHDNVLQIVLLPGALSDTVEIEIEPSDVPPPIFGPAYRVRPDIELMIDAEVTYRRVLPSNPEGVAVAAIRRDDFEDGQGAWLALPRIELDIEHSIVTGIDSELSLFYGMLEGLGGSTTDTGTDTGAHDDSEGTTGGDVTGDTTGGFGPLSHELDLQPIWDAHCLTNCHEPGGLNTDIVLTADRAYEELLEGFPVAANLPYVDAGDPSRSYLLHKLDNRQGEAPGGGGLPMPMNAELLPVEIRDMVEAWIEQGAPP